MKLFGFPLSPFVRKAALAATEKGLDFEWEPTAPHAPSDEFARISPFHKIPALKDGDFNIADSSAIVTYLDCKYPDPALIPATPEGRARAVWFDEVVDTVLVPAGAPIMVNRFLKPTIFGTEGDEAAAVAAEEAIVRPLDYIEGELDEDGWLLDQFTVSDIALASAIKTLSYAGWKPDSARYPKVAAWFGRVTEREAWKKVAAHEAQVFARLSG